MTELLKVTNAYSGETIGPRP